ncbi:hypothetical protein HMPREF1022_01282 [Desulfovibrio sp. 6_1_46AFAA]|uniref:SpoIIE family protein phosphatase n=1 Tax=Desulfovibrio sp. 6_1_46AFAA TaxID=665942 RepID=UPI0002236EED|nr:SpoIIE family protein phosphatase [Desulfovibrio sp. 6_1_46AFAA]EGW51741.1 hypothetical protein HMPREF1022_01282 [Desulfovibrio sp. 6_1_46AFAA]
MPIFATIRFKMLCVVVMLAVLLGLAVFLVGKGTYRNYKTLQISQCRSLVAEETAKVEDTIQDLQANARELAMIGELLFQAAPDRLTLYGPYAVLRNFQINTAAVGGGIWYKPYLLDKKRELACFYAYSQSGGAVFDESFSSPEYHYPTQSWYLDVTRQLDALGPGARETAVWSRPYVDATGTHALMTTVSSGMYDQQGAFLGLATVDWQLGDIARQIADIRPTPNSIILFADTAHDVILNLSDPSRSQGFTNVSPRSIPWFESNAPSERILVHNGASYLSFFKKLSNGMSVVVNVPEEDLFRTINRALRLTLLILAGIILLAAGLTWALLNRFINRPVAVLSRAAAEVGAGNLNAEFPLRSKDELGVLARSFSTMTRSLKSHIEHLGTVTAEKERIATELHIARDIQASMLPSIFPPCPERDECDLRAFMLPAKEVGGDFFDFFFVDDTRLAIVIADVSDKGVPAALFMVIAKTLLRNNAPAGANPGEVLAATNVQLCENNSTGMFVTAFIGILDVRTGAFEYANAGHNPFFVKRPGKPFERIAPKPGLPLAVMDDTLFQTEMLNIERGSSLFFYTDGVTDATNPENVFFGEDRLRDTLTGLGNLLPGDLQGFITGVKNNLDRFAHGARQNDDITMLALAYIGPQRTQVQELTETAPAPAGKDAAAGNATTLVRERHFPAQVAAIPEFMKLVEENLAASPFTQRQRMRFAVAAEEVFANIANYAYAGRSDHGLVEARLELRRDPAALTLQLADSGQPFNPLECGAPDVSLPAEKRTPGGLGIFLAGQGTNAMTYARREGKNVLTMLLEPEQEPS